MRSHRPLSIWFFIGGLLAVYGLLILIAGVRQISHPPASPVVLQHLHAGVWWGTLLLVVGLLYLWCFRPSRHAQR